MGEAYAVADAACFMNAPDALAMRACRFGPMTDPKDPDLGLMLKTLAERCAIVRPPGIFNPPGEETPPPP
jgi:hypothetical protein